MLTIHLEEELADQVIHLAGTEARSAEEVVQEAVRRYLTEIQRAKIRAETEAFEQQLAALRLRYGDEYVAIHQGEVIDHDADLRTLRLRVFQHLGHVPVLLKRVSNSTERDLVFRNPRLERPE